MNPDAKAEELVSLWIAQSRYYFDGALHPKAREALVRIISDALAVSAVDAKPKKATKEKA